MNPMIERVARAIAKERGSWYADEGQWRHCEGEARAAIAAMRKVTKEMVIHGDKEADNNLDETQWSDWEGHQYSKFEWRPGGSTAIFKAMIDEALK